MSSQDIPLDVGFAKVARERSLKIADALRVSLLWVVVAMAWALPLSGILAVNLFRVAVILWLGQVFRRRELPRSQIFLPLLCFFAITATAGIAAQDRATSWQGMKVVELGFAAVLVADSLRGLRQLGFLVSGLLLSSVVAGLVAIGQVHAGAMLRAQGLYRHYINFGEMLLLVSLLCFGLLVASIRRRSRLPWSLLLTAALGLLTVALAATATRTFLAALLFGCAVMIWMCFRWKARALAAAALLVAIVAGGWWLESRRGMTWFDSADPGTQYRFLIWKDGVRIIRAHPLLGVGLANVQRHPDRFDMSAYRTFPKMISHFHSVPIEIAADCGIPALVVWCWLMYCCWAAAWGALNPQGDSSWFRNGIALGVLGVVAAFQLASLFHFVLGDPEPMLIFWILMGVVIILEQQNQSLVTDPQ